MQIEALVRSAATLIRRGRFIEALNLLQGVTVAVSNHFHQSLLADVLQRTGHNLEAEIIALRGIRSAVISRDVLAYYHFVLGNVLRDRGDNRKSIDHFSLAEQTVLSDVELLCWVQFRLLSSIADVGGSQASLRVSRLKSTLARCGEARPLATFHLWIAKTESIQGNLNGARRHLRIAESLLKQVDDAWLQCLFAITSFGVSYHCGDIASARKWARLAVEQSAISGHHETRLASHANLGHIELSVGHLSEAEHCFQTALEFCEEGSGSYIALLDSLAQIKLLQDDLLGCRQILNSIERLSTGGVDADTDHYQAWTLQTKIQLLLRQAQVTEAMKMCDVVKPLLNSSFHPRINTVLRLLGIETTVAAGNFTNAARQLPEVLLPPSELPPDLFAETERIVGKVLLASGSHDDARVHFDRSIRTFDAIGHAVGKKNALADLEAVPGTEPEAGSPFFARRSLGRFRTLLETRKRPELFYREAMHLLDDLECCESASIVTGARIQQFTDMQGCPRADGSPEALRFNVPLDNDSQLSLEFVPTSNPAAIVSALAFQKVIKDILDVKNDESEFEACDVLWSETNGAGPQESIFASEGMLKILKTINKVAATSLNVLITGETGVGKEVIAKAIHKNSDRASGPFIALNCAAVPKDLLESQLFGYRRGAFSGASESFQGVVRAANGGTLLLDEIGDIPLETQPKLLRFLESSEIHPLGESRPSKVNVRLLFATNSNLEEAIKQNRFREDLFFRINVISIRVPPLRERREEIPLLANLFAHRFSTEMSKDVARFSTEAMEALILYSWPGNVRQLGNEVRRLIATTESGALITSSMLSSDILASAFKHSFSTGESPQITLSLKQPIAAAVTELERLMVEHALSEANGHVTKAAQILGVSRKGLYLKRHRLGIADNSNRAYGA